MYHLYGSKNSALVKTKENPEKLVVWNRGFAIDRRQKQINKLKKKETHLNL
jgi:hypothetical protein